MCFGIFSPFEDKAKCRKADTGLAEPWLGRFDQALPIL